MPCLGRFLLLGSPPINNNNNINYPIILKSPFLCCSSFLNNNNNNNNNNVKIKKKKKKKKTQVNKWQQRTMAMAVDSDDSTLDSTTDKNNTSFCIIEGPETVQDFANMELQEIQDNIRSRRNKIFLLMEEVRRLRIQQRIQSAELGFLTDQQEELPNFPSFIPFLPPLTAANLKIYYASCFSLITGIILFGGLLAPALELKLGIGGTSYEDFIRNMHLPMQLSQVDPIVASFSGGAVGVISALMVVEVNNVQQQEHKRCKYCVGTGYLSCARCSSTGSLVLIDPVSAVHGSSKPVEVNYSDLYCSIKVEA